MAQTIDAPDGTSIDFPDEMGDADIKAVMRRKYPAPASSTSPAPSLGSDTDSASGALIGEGYKADPDLFAHAWEGFKGGLTKANTLLDPLVGADVTGNDPNLQAPNKAEIQQGVLKRAKAAKDYEARAPSLGLAGAVGEGAVPFLGAMALAPVAGAASLAFPGPLAGVLGSGLTYGTAGAVQKGAQGGTPGEIAGAGLSEAGTAMGAHAVMGAIQRGLSPFASDYAQTLLSHGVTPTPGQMLGTAASKIEDWLGSKFTGSGISFARGGVLKKANQAAVNDAIAPTERTVSRGNYGLDATNEANDIVSNHYDTHLGNAEMPPAGTQHTLAAAQQAVTGNPVLAAGGGADINNFVQTRVAPYANDTLTGRQWKAIDSDMGARMVGAQTAEERDAWRSVQGAWRNELVGLTPEAKQGIANANAGYRNMIPINKATDAALGNGLGKVGQFSPLQLAKAQGRDNMTPLARASLELLPTSGSTGGGTALAAAGTGALSALLKNPGAAKLALMAGIGSNVAYSPPIRSMIARGVPGLRSLPLSLGRGAATVGATLGSPN